VLQENILMVRKKTKLEALFSLKRYRRRKGATDFFNKDVDYRKLKNSIITADNLDGIFKTDEDLNIHLSNIKKEFVGKPELLFYCIKLIILLRRGFKEKEVFSELENLWNQEGDFLLQQLNSRWLISVADTYADHKKSDLYLAISVIISSLLNTVKLYESELLFLKESNPYQQEVIDQVRESRVELFDGIEAFKLGSEDTLMNMMQRVNNLPQDIVPTKILLELFHRLNHNNTVYSRFKKLHTRKHSNWW